MSKFTATGALQLARMEVMILRLVGVGTMKVNTRKALVKSRCTSLETRRKAPTVSIMREESTMRCKMMELMMSLRTLIRMRMRENKEMVKKSHRISFKRSKTQKVERTRMEEVLRMGSMRVERMKSGYIREAIKKEASSKAGSKMTTAESITLEAKMRMEKRIITVMGRTTSSFPTHCRFPSKFRSK
jgi:transcriptional regulator of nitric oxide reductase